MYYNSYDDYMRGVLGYNNMNQMNNYTYGSMYDDFEYQDLNEFYPDIYRIVYPEVCRECSRCNTRGFSREIIDDMVERIYNTIEDSNFYEGDIRGEQSNKSSVEKKPANTGISKTEIRSSEQERESKDIRDTRAPRNNLLKDFIRVLLLRELIGNRPPNINCRPGGGPGPCRPPRW